MSSLPLHCSWTLMYDYQQRGKATQENWKDVIKQVALTDKIPSLLYILENMGNAEEWPHNSNIHFFRSGIEPAWEDENNINGGKWVLELENSDRRDERINELWKRTVLFCVSEQTDNEVVCGCVFSPRRFVDRISLWTSNKDETVKKVGNLWKDNAGFKDRISFKIHENALKGVRNRDSNLFEL